MFKDSIIIMSNNCNPSNKHDFKSPTMINKPQQLLQRNNQYIALTQIIENVYFISENSETL